MKRSRTGALVVVGALAVTGLVACDDDGPSGPTTIDLAAVAGLYQPISITFDPQGSAPAADVLEAINEVEPQLNISNTANFQIPHRNPVDGNYRLLEGTVETTVDGIRLVFESQADADLLLLPRTLPLTFDDETNRLSYSGSAQVSRARLLELFPELYAEEQLFNPTPGTLTVVFARSD